ncbi:alpha/beta fold hydrolase [Pseudoluteimonas lycopersici]|uniref:Alpha/beta fold hydrolase n=1 Tax=Pseudoluteimonas lycopersici TaxID=1324796 RepID=A0A516V7P0_9GAMM|nr:alpha/beta hydrolase [Lysobacter lycopersici]QDQ74547.1 alpha/beta fold hydrolase [Lysobacter lycopersici]
MIESAANEPVLLVHGLWMRGITMRWLATRLRSRGFEPRTFEYFSLLQDTDAVVSRLADALRERPRTHVLAHSLGGLLALRAAEHAGADGIGRIVCLGSPLAGSSAAASIAAKLPAGAQLVGHNRALLESGVDHVPEGIEVGAIAGCVPHGLGGFVAHFDGEHDGSVAVAETRLPGLADHVVLRASHSGLLFSDPAVRQAVAFLREGHFDRDFESGVESRVV